MKYITGFFMAWGNFLTIPCPLKRWDKDLNNLMLGFLPSVGAVVGGLWVLAAWLLNMTNLPIMVTGFFLTVIPFVLCGFMHLDGFMDCNDAILSRRPLEERQRILKDSHIGAFAVVTLIFILMGFYGAMTSSVIMLDLCTLGIIPVLSRTFAGCDVLTYKPIGHSQYAKGKGATDKRGKTNAKIVLAIQLIIYITVAILLTNNYRQISLVIAMTVLGTMITGTVARKQLGGMSGDIAGFEIVVGEFCGVMAMAVGQSIL